MPRGLNDAVEAGATLSERNELVHLAEMYMGHEIFVWNANINGIVVQLRTNDPHLDDFWRENWFAAGGMEHEHSTRPHGIIYAVTNVPETEPRSSYHSETKTAIVINKMEYEVVRSIALGIASLVEAILRDEHSVMTVSTLLDGYCGIRDVCLSLPAVIHRGGIHRIIPLELAPDEQAALRRSADTLKGVLRSVGLQARP